MTIDFVGIIVAAIVSMAIGFLWYNPMLFGKRWMKERGYTAEGLKKQQKEMGKWYGVSFVVSLVTAWVLTVVLSWSGAISLGANIQTAFLMWLGFNMPVQLTATIFSEKKNFTLLWIDSGYQLVSILGMGIVLAYL